MSLNTVLQKFMEELKMQKRHLVPESCRTEFASNGDSYIKSYGTIDISGQEKSVSRDNETEISLHCFISNCKTTRYSLKWPISRHFCGGCYYQSCYIKFALAPLQVDDDDDDDDDDDAIKWSRSS